MEPVNSQIIDAITVVFERSFADKELASNYAAKAYRHLRDKHGFTAESRVIIVHEARVTNLRIPSGHWQGSPGCEINLTPWTAHDANETAYWLFGYDAKVDVAVVNTGARRSFVSSSSFVTRQLVTLPELGDSVAFTTYTS